MAHALAATIVFQYIDVQREMEEKARQPKMCSNIFTERDGRKGPPAGNKAKCKVFQYTVVT
jgi:hypothetical protein